ncbi:phosphoglycerol transferase [Fibrobacter sp. UWB10]|nr:phosphoglycerol transferase [Fibrobacter sp. UWB10]
MHSISRPILFFLKIAAIAICLIFIIEHYFLEISPFFASPEYILSFLALIILNWRTKHFQKKDYFKPSHIPLVIAPLFLAVLFRTGFVWALSTFPLKDANTVLLTLQEPFDDFAYSMVRQYLTTTIPQALVITIVIAIFLYVVLNNTKKRLVPVGIYIIAAIIPVFYNIPISDYIHILNNEPEKNTAYSKFFVENYVNPDSVIITPPQHKRNLILIYLESLETSFADRIHGGNQDTNLIPEITELALQNLSFGKNKKNIGGGLDAIGSTSTFPSMHSRSLGIPNITIYSKTPILHHYKSIYKILNEYDYKQIFFQGNSGLYKQFRQFAIDQKIDEIYGPDDLIQRLDLDTADLIRKQGYKTVQDKETFIFAHQILDTISEPFSLTFFTIDTHAPSGLYDPDCIKINDEKNEDERLKASARCVSRELNKFLDTLRTKAFYGNTSIVVFGDHLFPGNRLVKGATDRKWVNFFINPSKVPVSNENRLYSDIDMFPTILSSINFNIDGERLGFGTDLFGGKKTLIECIGLDSLNKEIRKMSNHLMYESYLLIKKQNKEE